MLHCSHVIMEIVMFGVILHIYQEVLHLSVTLFVLLLLDLPRFCSKLRWYPPVKAKALDVSSCYYITCTFNTYLLGPRETICFVVPRPPMCPRGSAKERTYNNNNKHISKCCSSYAIHRMNLKELDMWNKSTLYLQYLESHWNNSTTDLRTHHELFTQHGKNLHNK